MCALLALWRVGRTGMDETRARQSQAHGRSSPASERRNARSLKLGRRGVRAHLSEARPMLVSHILREKGRDVLAIPAEATLFEAARVLTLNRIGALLVGD